MSHEELIKKAFGEGDVRAALLGISRNLAIWERILDGKAVSKEDATDFATVALFAPLKNPFLLSHAHTIRSVYLMAVKEKVMRGNSPAEYFAQNIVLVLKSIGIDSDFSKLLKDAT